MKSLLKTFRKIGFKAAGDITPALGAHGLLKISFRAEPYFEKLFSADEPMYGDNLERALLREKVRHVFERPYKITGALTYDICECFNKTTRWARYSFSVEPEPVLIDEIYNWKAYNEEILKAYRKVRKSLFTEFSKRIREAQ